MMFPDEVVVTQKHKINESLIAASNFMMEKIVLIIEFMIYKPH